jgi:EAL domain-containing protein (putative c-di-GMP-specific phosphodiesterase class I)
MGLEALKRLPTRYLRVSLAALEERTAQHAALRTTQRLARGLGIAAIADGITDANRFRRVQDSGMAYASGDHLSAAAALDTL